MENSIEISKEVSVVSPARVDDANSKSIFQSSSFKKYKLALIVIGVGCFFAPVAVLGGILAGLGTKLGMDRLRESAPSVYNWVLDNPGWVEIISMGLYAGAFGLTLGGVLISLVANFTMSLVLDYYAEQEGRVEGAKRLSMALIIKGTINKIKSIFVSIRDNVKEGLAESNHANA